MQRPTQSYIETCKSYPVSIAAAIDSANERRKQLNADIELFLANGGKIAVIETSNVCKKSKDEPLQVVDDYLKTREIWAKRRHYDRLISKYNLKKTTLARNLGLDKNSMTNYLNGQTEPTIQARMLLENAIDALVKNAMEQQT